MEDFWFYNEIRIINKEAKRNTILDSIFSRLQKVYDSIPETKGCLENNNKDGGCGSWCCFFQTPHLLYSEFLFIWDFICKNWNDEKICDLFRKCMINAVDTVPSKGCIFLNHKNHLCEIHERRPQNCRIYGITPKEEFEPRYQRLKKEYENIKYAVIKNQCDLVSTVNGEEVTTKDTKRWWNNLVRIEKDLGIPKRNINDDMGGSYRSPHDHVLLYNMPQNVLHALAGIRNYNDFSEKIRAVTDLVSVIKTVFKFDYYGKRNY